MFDRPVTICVDGSAIPHRPQNRDAPDSCIKNASSDESVWCYEHVTISAVDCRRSLKLGSMMMRDKGDQADIVMELLLQVKEHLNIGWVIWDSGFDKGDLISFCNHHGIRFCARKTRGGDIVEEMAENPVEEDGVTAIRPDYTYTSGANCDLFAVKRGEIGLSNMVEEERKQASLHDFAPSDDDVDDEDEDDEGEKWILWATNSESLDENNIIAHGMLYRIRWSIETSYRVIKERFKASTTSISDALRVWVWKLATVLYNAWVLLRILIRDAGAALDPGESAIRTHSFQRILKTEFG